MNDFHRPSADRGRRRKPLSVLLYEERCWQAHVGIGEPLSTSASPCWRRLKPLSLILYEEKRRQAPVGGFLYVGRPTKAPCRPLTCLSDCLSLCQPADVSPLLAICLSV
jgi:hypothetical protein